jgi:hypothetical protein
VVNVVGHAGELDAAELLEDDVDLDVVGVVLAGVALSVDPSGGVVLSLVVVLTTVDDIVDTGSELDGPSV